MAFRVRSPHGAERNRRFQYGLLYLVQCPQSMLLSHKRIRTHSAKDSINLPSEHFAQTSAENFAETTALVRISIPCSTTVTTYHYSTHYRQWKRSSLEHLTICRPYRCNWTKTFCPKIASQCYSKCLSADRPPPRIVEGDKITVYPVCSS